MSRSAWLRVGDMLDAARAAIEWCDDVDAQQLADDPMRLAAIEWQLLVLGEAAKAVPDHIRAQAPDLDWRRIVRLRDFLAHDYASIEPDELWSTRRPRREEHGTSRIYRLILGCWGDLDGGPAQRASQK